MNRTKIEWCDFSYNPITGCRHGCRYCYARAMYRRFGHSFEPAFHPTRLSQPLRVRKPSRIFLGSVTDLCGPGVEDAWIEAVIDVVRRTPQHTYQALSKAPERWARHDWPANVWLGATATDQAQWNRAADGLRDAVLREPRRITFVSAEPLLSRIDPGQWMPHWLIIGAQTGPGGRQPEDEWVAHLESRAAEDRIAVFHKPNLTIRPAGRREFPVAA